MKFCGNIGFWTGDTEVSEGIWEPNILERKYFGEFIKNYRKNQDVADKINKDITVTNRISILSDLYAQNNWNNIRYIVLNGIKWEVASVELNYPRLYLDLGGKYHGEEISEESTQTFD